MGKDWIPIRIKTEPAKMRFVQSRIAGYPDEVMQKYYFQFLQSIVASGADVMREYIRTHNFGDKSGKRGRVKTGLMKDSVKWTVYKDGKNVYRFRLGWINGTPGYAIFQEQGTKNGVIAMNSIGYTMDFIRKELRLLETNPKGYRITNASRWNFGNEEE